MLQIWHEFLNDQSAFGELFKTWIFILGLIIVLCFVVGELTQNFSQVDKTWSIMPIIYGIMGFLMTALWCWIYNVIAKRIGGIEVELETMEEQMN